MQEIPYTPPPTVQRFMLNDAKYRAIMGPVGSGKSVGCCFEIIRRASLQEPGVDGIRRSRCLVVRQTVRQLVDTTIKTFCDWFKPGVCGEYFRTSKTFLFKLGDVECEIMFRGLDDPDDVANLNSLEITFAWINECRDISSEILDAMTKRVGRFPSKKDKPDHIPDSEWPTYHGIWADTNPPVIDTYWYYVFEHLDPKDGVSTWNNNWSIYKQPSGRGPYAENAENLPEGYYDTVGRSREYIRVFIDGNYGTSLSGVPVYANFSNEYHVSKGTLKPISSQYYPIVVGVDLGLTPSAVVGQLDPKGRALIFAEAVSENMGMQRFLATMLKPLLYARFSGHRILIVTDPAGVQRAQTDERSVVDIIKAAGFKVIPAKTNSISARVNAVDDYLLRQLDGDSGFLVDPSCSNLRAAMIGGYRYKTKTNGETDTNAPEKNKHSHVAEALQYLCLHLGQGGGENLPKRKDIQQVSAVGWT